MQEDPPYSIRVINSGKKHRRTNQEHTFFDYAMGLQELVLFTVFVLK